MDGELWDFKLPPLHKIESPDEICDNTDALAYPMLLTSRIGMAFVAYLVLLFGLISMTLVEVGNYD